MVNKGLSIDDLKPIDRETLIAAMKYLKDSYRNPGLDDISGRFQITTAKTEKLLNDGIEMGFIKIEIKRGILYGTECSKFSLTEKGRDFLNQNQS